MKPEHEAMLETIIDGLAEGTIKHHTSYDGIVEAFIRAAQERGWVLAKLPDNRRPKYDDHVPPEDGNAAEYWTDGFEDGLDAIETIELEESE